MQETVRALIERHLPGPLRPTGEGNFQTRCPFHKEGHERTPSFSVNVQKGAFQCFTCHVAGDIRRLLRLLGLSRAAIDREVAPVQDALDRGRREREKKLKHLFTENDPFRAPVVLPESLLGVYDWMPLSLVNKGFDPALLQDREVGYDRTHDRITYPIRDQYGNLAGVAGGATLPTQGSKYRFYQGGQSGADGRRGPGDFGDRFDQEFPGYRCRSHDFLWGYERVFPTLGAMSAPGDKLVLVEGFKACLWALQQGMTAVALMGSYISELQQRMLHRFGGTLVLLLDNDDAGRRATVRVGDLLYRPLYSRVQVALYPEGDDQTQPDDYPGTQITSAVENAVPFTHYLGLRASSSPTGVYT